MSDLIIKKNGTDYELPMLAEHYPADRVYLDGDITKTVQDAIVPFTKISYAVNSVSISNAWGSIYNADIEIPVSADYRNKKIVATFIPSSSFAVMFGITEVTATKIKATLVRGTTATVSGTVNLLIYD